MVMGEQRTASFTKTAVGTRQAHETPSAKDACVSGESSTKSTSNCKMIISAIATQLPPAWPSNPLVAKIDCSKDRCHRLLTFKSFFQRYSRASACDAKRTRRWASSPRVLPVARQIFMQPQTRPSALSLQQPAKRSRTTGPRWSFGNYSIASLVCASCSTKERR